MLEEITKDPSVEKYGLTTDQIDSIAKTVKALMKIMDIAEKQVEWNMSDYIPTDSQVHLEARQILYNAVADVMILMRKNVPDKMKPHIDDTDVVFQNTDNPVG